MKGKKTGQPFRFHGHKPGPHPLEDKLVALAKADPTGCGIPETLQNVRPASGGSSLIRRYVAGLEVCYMETGELRYAFKAEWLADKYLSGGPWWFTSICEAAPVKKKENARKKSWEEFTMWMLKQHAERLEQNLPSSIPVPLHVARAIVAGPSPIWDEGKLIAVIPGKGTERTIQKWIAPLWDVPADGRPKRQK